MFRNRILCTLQLMLYALLPPAGRAGAARKAGEVPHAAPSRIRAGMDRFLDDSGELRVFFPRCLPIAAPFLMFRLKREGFSRCTVRASDRGLYVQGRR